MKGICPNCEKERELESVRRGESIEVRGESIEVGMVYYKCLTCGEEFEDPRSDYDPLDKAYREYRRRHEVTQPEEIKSFRKKHGLTQYEMSSLLGWGYATLNRYENGALQSEAHEKTLRLVMNDSHNLLKLIEEASNILDKEKRDRLINELEAEEDEAYSFKRIYEERFGRYETDELNGYRKLNISKLFNVILFFCKGGVFKTTLNKLLFYADFKHFKDYAVSITGARYARVPFGPAPDNYGYYFATLIENGSIEVEEIPYSENVIGEKFVSLKEPDLSIFSNSELKVLTIVKERFTDYTAKMMTDFSHNEKGYKETSTGDLISYAYADELQL